MSEAGIDNEKSISISISRYNVFISVKVLLILTLKNQSLAQFYGLPRKQLSRIGLKWLVEVFQSEEALKKDMEWYFGFGLMLSIVWVYLEVLRLLSNLTQN